MTISADEEYLLKVEDERDFARADLQTAVGLLKQVQWRGDPSYCRYPRPEISHLGSCPICGYFGEVPAHYADCELGAFLKRMAGA